MVGEPGRGLIDEVTDCATVIRTIVAEAHSIVADRLPGLVAARPAPIPH